VQAETAVGDLSPHFDSSEFVDRRTGDRPVPPDALVAVLERIRALTGRPLVVVSGYRCLVTNRSVGGARESQHTYNRAADIPPGHASVAQALEAGARGVGHRGGSVVHVDVRPGPVAVWEYP
jgi:uncharacterized protein YcbK (DUF882 family)